MGAEYSGELAALATALMFTFGSVFFTFAGRSFGSMLVNQARLVLSLAFIIGLHWLILGKPFPQDVTAGQWFWLGVSGVLGLALGDASLFQAFLMIGPRLSMLVFAVSPVMGAVMAWAFLRETLNMQEMIGIVLTIGGIGIVVAEQQGKKKSISHRIDTRTYLIGIGFALGGAAGQAAGLIAAKAALADDYPPLSALIIRLFIALLAVWGFAILRGDVMRNIRKLRDYPQATGFLTLASLAGPAIGVWLSLIAIQRAPIGITSTLMSLTPIFLLPVGYVIFKDEISIHSVIGTIVAFAGTALLFL